MTLNFAAIRGDTIEARRAYFEQLVCRLAEQEGGEGQFRRIRGEGGDGGVEAVRLLPGGGEEGWQSKYFPDKIQWGQLDKSVRAALRMHPRLVRYVIAVPCDFTGTKRVKDGKVSSGDWGKWEARVEKWQQWAQEADKGGPRATQVVVEAWTAFDLEKRLNGLEGRMKLPLVKYFFTSTPVLTLDWFEKMHERTLHTLHSRYSPKEHVDTGALRVFDVLLRSERLRKDLEEVFDETKVVDIAGAKALVTGAEEMDTTAAEEALAAFQKLRQDIELRFEEQWLQRRWGEAWRDMVHSLLDLFEKLRSLGEANEGWDESRLRTLLPAYHIGRREMFPGSPWWSLLPVDAARAVLLVGETGAGKSHLLAHGATQARAAGFPVIHLLGEHFAAGNPRAAICEQLELAGWTFLHLLGALDLAAEAEGKRALLIIDGINEGSGLNVWNSDLASIIKEVVAHPRLCLLLSCRDEDEHNMVISQLVAGHDMLYPREGHLEQGALAGKMVRVDVQGFDYLERRKALRIYCESYGIVQPTMPLLGPELSNPLLLSSICRSMRGKSAHSFPWGTDGVRKIFDSTLAAKAKALITCHRHDSEVKGALENALEVLAGEMLASRSDYVPLLKADDLVVEAFKMLPIQNQSWLKVLEGADVVRRDRLPGDTTSMLASKPVEIIRFASQRLGNFVLARNLFKQVQKGALDDAFADGGPWAFLLHRYRDRHGDLITEPTQRWVGALGALWAFVAEDKEHKRELWDLKSFWGDHVKLYREKFHSVFMRAFQDGAPSAFEDYNTLNRFNLLWEDEPEEKLALLMSFACMARHPWNMDYLEGRLLGLATDDRPPLWDQRFTREYSELYLQAKDIVDFSRLTDLSSLDEATGRLVAKCLAWLSLASNSSLAACAAEGFNRLAAAHPSLRAWLAAEFDKRAQQEATRDRDVALKLKAWVETSEG